MEEVHCGYEILTQAMFSLSYYLDPTFSFKKCWTERIFDEREKMEIFLLNRKFIFDNDDDDDDKNDDDV